MDLRALYLYSTIKIVVMITVVGWLLPGDLQSATFQNANNEDISVLISTEHYYGNHIGDLIPLKIIVRHKTDGVKVANDRIPKAGHFGDFEIAGVETREYPDRTEFLYKLQTFLPPKWASSANIGSFDLYYTANRYWREKDQQYVYRKLQIQPFSIFQNSLDPENRVPFVYEYEYFSYRTELAYLLIAGGTFLLLAALFPLMRKFVLRYVHDRSYYRSRAFLRKIIADDLSLYNTVNICRRLNRIRKDDLLVKVLYQQYRPRAEEIKRLARDTLTCIEERRCSLPQSLKTVPIHKGFLQ